ncbi:recombinase family protein [Vibrio sp. Vb2131]|nr:recombinase family protein [Vibrio sp. Vb2131]MCA6721011.1 recombinase family protein [Vibrio alginolyticus]MDW1885579.1 recombinase family protein [Vibrio sp. Vb2131]MDW2259630.1 recombinase family protein [Vibrio sp. 1409]
MTKIAYSYTRLSTEKQIKGHGFTRQREAIEKVCCQHGWQLSDQTFNDLGVSAWKGANATTGALSQFIDLAKKGAIRPNSVLIVESVDRLSRQQVDKSLRLMLELLEVGVSIFTLSDSKLYTTNSDSVMLDLMMWLMTAQRAHEESEIKSLRVRAAKKKNKELIRKGIIVTRKCPEWLTVSDDKSCFLVNNERAEIVRKIFTWYSQGFSTKPIALKLNELGIPYWGKSSTWSYRHIRSLLKHRGVIGEIQLLKRIDGRDVADGDPVEDYYPAIIDRGLWATCQQIKSSKTTAKGRVVERGMANLFRGLLKCECGSGLAINSSTVKGRTYRFLRCSQLKTTGCQAKNWHYEKTERILLIALRRFLSSFNEEGHESAVKEAETKCALLREELMEKQRQATKLLEMLLEKDSDLMRERFDSIETQVNSLKDALKLADERAEALSYEKDIAFDKVDKLQSVLEEIANDDDARHKANGLLRRMLDTITLGAAPNPRFSVFKEFSDKEYQGLMLIKRRDGHEIKVEVLNDYKMAIAWDGDDFTVIECMPIQQFKSQTNPQNVIAISGQSIDLLNDDGWVSSF